MLVCNVVGARPNFMKIAPIVEQFRQRDIPQILVHTGQHYDASMSRVFFEELKLPRPDIYLGIGSDTHARQTARIMMAFEDVLQEHQPDLVLVTGDVNSTLACALVAAKLNVPVAHVEAGLRSFDRRMPEEVNRVLTDHLSDLLFTTEASGDANLHKEGMAEAKIHFVGNCMVDTLLKHAEAAKAATPWEQFDLAPGEYGLLTLHRPSNVDERTTLTDLMTAFADISTEIPLLFPVHPRTRKRLQDWHIQTPDSLRLTEPLSYLVFLGLMANARFVITDSGGIQGETTTLGIPCLTARWNTESPVTLGPGTNRLVGTDTDQIRAAVQEILSGQWDRQNTRPPLWDGQASARIADVVKTFLATKAD